jgi:hypothetical protein
MSNEKEFIEYVKSKVKFENRICSVMCGYFSGICFLFRTKLKITNTNIFRCEDCKKYFND